MASNPIKRRARQSFFLGFLIALVVMAIIVMLLVTKINSLNEENETLKILGPKVSVYTVSEDIEEGQPITMDDLTPSTMQLTASSTTIDVENYIDPSIFYAYDEETGEDIELNYTAKVQIPAGSVVTLSMLQQGDIEKTERRMEYSVIVLPSELNNGDYIDIRLRLPNGAEYIVLSKKKVDQCTANTVWMNMSEEEIQTMNSVIVDAYTTVGSELRATVYTNPLMQEASKVNYPIREATKASLVTNPNILPEALRALAAKWQVKSDENQTATDLTLARELIDVYTTSNNATEQAEEVESGISEEVSTQNENRNNYVSAVEGTGLVGSTY